jgi:protein FrlC
MKISLTSFVYCNYPLEEALRRIAAAGFEGVDIWGGRPHCYRRDLDEADLASVRRLSEELNLAVPSFIPAQFRYPTSLCSPYERIRADSIAYIQDAIVSAAALGCHVVSVCPSHSLYGQSHEHAWEQVKRSLHTLCDFAAEREVRLALEPADRFETDLVQTSEQALRLLAEMGRDNLGVVLDSGHSHAVGEPPAEAARRLAHAGALYYVHIDDNFGERDQHLVPGDGTVDLSAFVAALREVGYDGYLAAELAWDYTTDPEPAVQRTAAYLRKLLA